jgi:hypothetical protein
VYFRLCALLSLVLAMGLVVAGCGDDDDDEATTAATTETAVSGAPLSEDEFIAEADAICEAGDAEIDAAAQDFFPEGGSPGIAEEKAFATEVLLPSIQEQIDQIRGLTPPEGSEDDVAAFLDTAQETVDELKEDPAPLTGGGSGGDPFAETERLATQLGLQVCAQG